MNAHPLRLLLTALFLMSPYAMSSANAEVAVNALAHHSDAHDSPISIKHTLISTPVAGKPLYIQFSFTPQANLESLVVKFTGSKGLDLGANNKVTFTGNHAAEQTITHTLRLIPPFDGRFYVNVFATTSIEGHEDTQVKSFAIPVGDAAQKSPFPVKSKDSIVISKEQPFVVMPAQETIEEENDKIQ